MSHYDSNGYDSRPSYDHFPLFSGGNPADAVAHVTRDGNPASALAVMERHVGGESTQTVNARELYNFLEVGRDFSNWIKDRIEQYGFDDGLNYITTVAKIGDRRNVKITEYHLTLDMAKELCMVERNERGAQARRYFIAMEAKAKKAVASEEQMYKFLGNPEFLLRLTTQYAERLKIAEAKIAEDAPKVQSHEELVGAKGGMLVREAAKELNPVTGQNRLYAWMEQPDVHILLPETKEPYQIHIDAGRFYLKPRSYEGSHGERKFDHTLIVTPKGLTYLQKRWRKYHQAIMAQGGAQ